MTAIEATPSRRQAGDAGLLEIAEEELQRRREEFLDAIARRAYELFQQRGGQHGYHVEDWLQAERELTRPLPWAFVRQPDGVRLIVEVPGFSAGQLKLYACGSMLLLEGHVHGTSPLAGLEHAQIGRDVYQFIPIPEGLSVRRATLDVEHGILQVQLPAAGAQLEAQPAAKAAKPATARKSRSATVKANPDVAAKSAPARAKATRKTGESKAKAAPKKTKQ